MNGLDDIEECDGWFVCSKCESVVSCSDYCNECKNLYLELERKGLCQKCLEEKLEVENELVEKAMEKDDETLMEELSEENIEVTFTIKDIDLLTEISLKKLSDLFDNQIENDYALSPYGADIIGSFIKLLNKFNIAKNNYLYGGKK